MKHIDCLFYDGKWQKTDSKEFSNVINSVNGEIIAKVVKANHNDIDKEVNAAEAAFPEWNERKPEERAIFLEKILKGIRERQDEIERVIVAELGSAISFVKITQVESSIKEMEAMLEEFKNYSFEQQLDNAVIKREGYGVVACVTPWNYPLNQIQRKVTPALLAGNTVIVKPASDTPLSAILFAEIIEKAGLPPGVFNLVTGSGSDAGNYLTSHPKVSVISFTGSTVVGKGLYQNAATTVKKLLLELGGKSAMIYLKGGDLNFAVKTAAASVVDNQGQTCSALSRLLVPRDKLDDVIKIVKDYYGNLVIGDPEKKATKVGPMVSKAQMERVTGFIENGKKEGAEVLIGGHQLRGEGYFIEPTVFINVRNNMEIAQQEIFGPVLVIITYDTIEEAIQLANDTDYGLSGAVVGPADQAYEVAQKLRTGNVRINNAVTPAKAPFGGYKQSGIGRENGIYGLEDYLEIKAIFR